MQIHELNNFSGTLGSGAYLAIDDGTDTGKISSQGLLAATEARIDNIIAGPAPSAEEIVDARLGADGVPYPSLGDAIRDQFTDVKSESFLKRILDSNITDLNNAVTTGFYVLAYSTEYANCPIERYTRRFLRVYSYYNQAVQIIENPITGIAFSRFMMNGTWESWVQDKQALGEIASKKSVGNITDLNNVMTTGYYGLAYSTAYANQPINNTRKLLLVYSLGGVIVQVFMCPDLGVEYLRSLAEGSWSSWVTEKTDIDSIKTKIDGNMIISKAVNYTDLDDVTESGYSLLGYSADYQHCPIGKYTRRWLITYKQSANLLMQILVEALSGMVYTRNFADNVWSEWEKVRKDLDADADNTILQYTNDSFTNTIPNVGTHLKVLSYNVANYNNDTATYISDEKLFNFKKMLSDTKPDVIGLQESRGFLDGNNTKPSHNLLYRPIFPFYEQGSGGSAVYSKYLLNNSVEVSYTNGRTLIASTININGKTLLMCSTHPVAVVEGSATSESAISARLIQYTEMFQWVYGVITLKNATTQASENCPSWDYCIICIDGNNLTSADCDNLKDLVESNNFTMANGGWLGWLSTAKGGNEYFSIDNILCSPNIIINSVDAKESLRASLYSDHVPIVADITLL